MNAISMEECFADGRSIFNGLEDDDPNWEEYYACVMKVVKIVVDKNKRLKENNLIEINYHNYPQQIKDSQAI